MNNPELTGAPPLTVIGAGPAGVLLALLLARRGHAVQIFERRADPRTSPEQPGRSINLALANRGRHALERAAVLERVSAHMVSMRGRQLHDENGEQRFLPYGQNEREVIYAVGRNRLTVELIEAASEQPRIAIQFDQRCVDIDPAGQTVRLRDELSGAERDEPYELLVAADGATSAVRQALAAQEQLQFTDTPLDHDYKELLIAPVDGRYAMEPHALHLWPRGGYMLIALPNTDASFTATLFLPRTGPVSFQNLPDGAAQRAFFAAQFPDALPLLPDLSAQFASHPQARLASLHCQPWQVGAAVLLGDAAHAIVPFHGQGLNSGFEDCVLLDELIAKHGPVPEALVRFERLRRPDTEAIASISIQNYREMRDTVRAPAFARRQALAAELERQFPGRFIPRYSMVMFHTEIGYAEAQRRGALQERILDRLLAAGPDAAAHAGKLLDEFGL
ncbi:MAG TPA: NAD(P)/FAD-dependent oxidoreductase [Steroidobacteraceae bacterium]